MRNLMMLVNAAFLAALLSGCAAGAGAGAAAGAYEYENEQALEELEQSFEAGEISRDEYLQRKEEIEQGSVVY